MPQFKAARLNDNDLLSSFDNALGDLERCIAEAFGFTLDEDITESPITFDNDGRVTKQVLKRYVPVQPPGTTAISWAITDTGGAGGLAFLQYITGEAFGSGVPFFYPAYPQFGLHMGTGDLWNPQYTLNGSANQTLAPAGAGSNLYLSAARQYSIPGIVPYEGCILTPSQLTIAASASDSMEWTESVDVGGCFTSSSPTVCTAPTTGKYFVEVSLGATVQSASTTVDVTGTLTKNGATTYGIFHVYETDLVAHQAHHFSIFTTVDLTAGDTVELEIANDSDGYIILGADALPEGSSFTGRMSFFRIG